MDEEPPLPAVDLLDDDRLIPFPELGEGSAFQPNYRVRADFFVRKPSIDELARDHGLTRREVMAIIVPYSKD